MGKRKERDNVEDRGVDGTGRGYLNLMAPEFFLSFSTPCI